MKVEYINPFIESVNELFESMLGTHASRGDLVITKEIPPNLDIVVLIGLNGAAKGTVAISFPVATALSMVGRMVGSEVRVVDEGVRDAVTEMVSKISSGAKSKLAGIGSNVQMSMPSVVRGNSYSVDCPSNSAWLEVPFTSELGEFSLRVTFDLTDNN